MTLEESIKRYFSLKSAFDRDADDHEHNIQILIPQAEDLISQAEHEKAIQQLAVRRAITPEEIQSARKTLEKIERDLENAVQLKSNLKAKSGTYNFHKASRESELKCAERDMWNLRKEQLLSEFSIPEEAFLVLEKLLVAGCCTKDTASTAFRIPIDEKYGRMCEDRFFEVKESLITEMQNSALTEGCQ